MRQWKSFLVRSLLYRGMTLSWFQRYGWKANIPVGTPTCHDFPRFVIISEKSRLEVGNHWRWSRFFSKKDPLRANFQKIILKDSPRHRTTSSVQISWNLSDWKSAKSCVVYLTKKQNFRKVSCSRFCADRAQNLPGTAPNNILGVLKISSKSVHFQCGAIAERVNIVETHHKVFPILGEASSSSNNNTMADVSCDLHH